MHRTRWTEEDNKKRTTMRTGLQVQYIYMETRIGSKNSTKQPDATAQLGQDSKKKRARTGEPETGQPAQDNQNRTRLSPQLSVSLSIPPSIRQCQRIRPH
jgi:hypothetical protein